MGKAIKSIEFVFENCESLVFNYPDVFMFNIWGEKESYHSYSNCILLEKSISGFYAGINKDAKPTHESCYWGNEGQEPNLYRLLQYKDVTQVLINFENSSSCCYFVEWPEGDSTSHSGQSWQKTEEGHIFYLSTMKDSAQEIPSIEDVDSFAYMAL